MSAPFSFADYLNLEHAGPPTTPAAAEPVQHLAGQQIDRAITPDLNIDPMLLGLPAGQQYDNVRLNMRYIDDTTNGQQQQAPVPAPVAAAPAAVAPAPAPMVAAPMAAPPPPMAPPPHHFLPAPPSPPPHPPAGSIDLLPFAPANPNHFPAFNPDLPSPLHQHPHLATLLAQPPVAPYPYMEYLAPGEFPTERSHRSQLELTHRLLSAPVQQGSFEALTAMMMMTKEKMKEQDEKLVGKWNGTKKRGGDDKDGEPKTKRRKRGGEKSDENGGGMGTGLPPAAAAA
ncbi:MAG: hypothetical protein Q9220_002246 [cf. Caloplaca sp. 1 TL-2023]